ncbi:MAG: hypothetical protein CW691_05410 [Candidatus Bathyarchaeum sp.]|nr:MAG: hypothetical protein CW691_05410 [Candidatus Bathyarchaeum sp.]
MEPNQFFYLILPLAASVFVLVGVIIYTKSKSQEDQYEEKLKKLRQLLFAGKLDRKTYVNLSRRLRYVKQFNSESSRLVSLLSDEKLDEETFLRLRHVLETTFKEKLDKLDDQPAVVNNKEPFDTSKF